jgi:hypothetical protein
MLGQHLKSQTGWPSIVNLPIESVVGWASKLQDVKYAMPNSPIGRALGALTHLIRQSSKDIGPLGLLWALSGLETLYCDSRENMRAQLASRTQSFLGPHPSGLKTFKKMYDYRSALVHGRVNVPFAHCPFDAMESHSNWVEESLSNEEFAGAVLLATIQQLVIKDWYGLVFQEDIQGAKVPAYETDEDRAAILFNAIQVAPEILSIIKHNNPQLFGEDKDDRD